MMKQKNCVQCGKMYSRKCSETEWKKNRFCSRDCHYKFVVENRTRKAENNPLWKGGKLDKKCLMCGISFQCWKYQSARKCCGLGCSNLYRKTPEFIENLSKKHTGKVISPETKKKISESQIGKRTGTLNPSWKGENVGYRALHEWIIKEKGTPDACEHCGVGKENGKRLVWANKSHEYLRDTNDWMRLCYRCHRKYDFPNEKHK